MLKRYKPRGDNVQAVKLSKENIEYASDWCGGNTYQDSQYHSLVLNRLGSDELVVVQLGDYLVKIDSGQFKRMSVEDFETNYTEMN